MPKAIIFDDSKYLRSWLTQILENHSFEVVAAADNRTEGMDQYAHFKPDLVLLDVDMPEENGVQILENIRSEHPESKVIVCSSSGNNELIDRCATLGAYEFVQKPNFERLSRILDQF